MLKIAIGHLNNQRAAQAFCDYLKSKGINAWNEGENNQYVVQISDTQAEDFASAELRDFLQDPSDKKYLDASWNEGDSNISIASFGTGQSGNNSFSQFLSRTGIMTRTLVLISILVTLITNFGENIQITNYLYIADTTHYQGGLTEIFSGQIWRLLTPVFLHFLVIHILFNMMWLWDLGGVVEKRQSALFLLFFVVSIGIMSNVIQFLATGPKFGGMSGVVYGLLGYTWIRSQKKNSGYFLHKGIVIMMIGWLILGYTGWIGPIGNAAHLSGLLLGMAYGFAWNQYE
ncbi:MAG: rhomboid family intramembrane serine protease [Gammaproteobacteria bacterium]|nr:rhomboid family intramembrane serine protease [Gammaproteobacteria bacterium]